MEDSPDIGLAIPYADKLAGLAPEAGHLIHMASHLYLRVGRYADAEDANRMAIAADAEMVMRLPADATYTKFAMHPKHFLWHTLLWEGARTEAKKVAAELAPHLRHMAMDVKQPLGLDAMVSAFTAVRFSDWDNALALEIPTTPVGALATHYARGLALVAKGRIAEARQDLEFLKSATFENAPGGYPPRLRAVSLIAASQLNAAITLAGNDPDHALDMMQFAAQQEDKLDNPLEPRMWIFSSRERLGALFLKLGRNQEAADAFRSDLNLHPENGWSLFGLMTALEALHDPQAPAIRARFQKAWARSDFELRPDLL
jgi:tetratricopeptide (TPR) repeat protein